MHSIYPLLVGMFISLAFLFLYAIGHDLWLPVCEDCGLKPGAIIDSDCVCDRRGAP